MTTYIYIYIQCDSGYDNGMMICGHGMMVCVMLYVVMMNTLDTGRKGAGSAL